VDEISGSHGGENKNCFFWVVASCSLVELYRRFRGACCLHRPDDGGSKYIRNVGKLLPDYTAQQSRKQPSLTLGGIVYREKKLLNEDLLLLKTTEQLIQNRFPLSTRIQEATGFPLKSGSS
jgi:hypothetical protein